MHYLIAFFGVSNQIWNNITYQTIICHVCVYVQMFRDRNVSIKLFLFTFFLAFIHVSGGKGHFFFKIGTTFISRIKYTKIQSRKKNKKDNIVDERGDLLSHTLFKYNISDLFYTYMDTWQKKIREHFTHHPPFYYKYLKLFVCVYVNIYVRFILPNT